MVSVYNGAHLLRSFGRLLTAGVRTFHPRISLSFGSGISISSGSSGTQTRKLKPNGPVTSRPRQPISCVHSSADGAPESPRISAETPAEASFYAGGELARRGLFRHRGLRRVYHGFDRLQRLETIPSRTCQRGQPGCGTGSWRDGV